MAVPRISGNGDRLEAEAGNHDDCVCALALAVHAGGAHLIAGSGAAAGDRVSERKGVGFFMWWKPRSNNAGVGGQKRRESSGVDGPAGKRVSVRARSGGGRGVVRLGNALASPGWDGEGDEQNPPGGLTTFVKMQHDAQIRACLTTKRLFVLSGDIVVTPADPSPLAHEAARRVEAEIQNALGGWASIVGGALDALCMGFVIGRNRLGRKRRPVVGFVARPPAVRFHYAPQSSGGEIAFVEVAETEEKFPISRFILYAYQGKWSSPLGQSDLLAAHGPWERKRALLEMWMSALDRFGTPTPIARVPIGWDEADTERLARQLGTLQNESSFVVPVDVELTTLEGSRSVEPGSAFLAAVDFENREIARALLGQELTTHSGANASGNGSNALGQVHQDVLKNWVRAVRADIAERVLTQQIARPITTALLGHDAPCPRVAWVQEKEV